jgi:hypothetical protein
MIQQQSIDESEEQFRSRLERGPVFGRPSPFVQALRKKAAQQKMDAIGVLLEVFSPGRFLPAYWPRFGLPDLNQEFIDLDIKTRIAAMERSLGSETDRLREKVRAAAMAWIDWRARALTATEPECFWNVPPRAKRLGDIRPNEWDREFHKWVSYHLDLKEGWDEVYWEIDELHEYLLGPAEDVNHRRQKEMDGQGGAKGYERPWVDELPKGWMKNAEAVGMANAFGNEHELSELSNLDLRALNKLLRRRDCGVKFMSKRNGRPAGRVDQADWQNYLRCEKDRSDAIEDAVEARAREMAS